jgi:hypothetical protein
MFWIAVVAVAVAVFGSCKPMGIDGKYSSCYTDFHEQVLPLILCHRRPDSNQNIVADMGDCVWYAVSQL